MTSKHFLLSALILAAGLVLNAQIPVRPGQNQYLLNEPVDISGDFFDFTNTHYLADNLKSFDPVQGAGVLEYKRYENSTRLAFNNMMGVLKPVHSNEFPTNEYEVAPNLPFSIEFVSARTIRIRANTGFQNKTPGASLMLTGEVLST